jgi:hypothetical protein
MVNRKLIRPNLAEIKERFSSRRGPAGQEAPRENHAGAAAKRRLAPPDQTNAEAFYYLKQNRVVRPFLPQGASAGRAEPSRVQARHSLPVQAGRRIGIGEFTRRLPG